MRRNQKFQNQYTVETCPPSSGTKVGILMACRLARRYSHRLPTPDELMSEWGMSRATAFRWISALRLSRTEAA